MAEPSFQDVFKLMNSMVSFEELLDATALKPETCVNLGIHEKFKQLYEKLGKYVQHEETKGLTFKSICNICCSEVKILNCDIRTSVAIHNAGDLHRVAAKMTEINKQEQEFGGKSVQQMIDLKNLPDDATLKPAGALASRPTSNNVDMKVDDKEWNLDLGRKSVPHLLDSDNVTSESIKSTGEITNNNAAKDIQPMVKSPDLNLETNSVAQLIDLNNIPNELLKTMPNVNSISQNEGFVSNNLNANIPSPCTSCQQLFCICGYKDKNMQGLNEKMTNVNLSQPGGTHYPPSLPGNYSVPPAPLFPGGIPPQGFKQPYANTRGRNPSPQSRTNKKPQEKRSSSSSAPVENNSTRQYLNVHVHMPPSGGQSQQTYTQPVNHQAQTKRNVHVHMPPSGGQSQQTYTQPVNHQAQTKRNVHVHMPPSGGQSQQTYTQPVNHQAQTKRNVHVHMPPSGGQSQQTYTQPVNHQAQTKRIVYVPMPPYGGQSQQAYTQPTAAPQRQSQTKKNTVEENLELLRSKTLGHQEEMQLMYKMLRQAEAGYWRRAHFSKFYNREQGRNEYVCNVCNTGSRMNCSLNVVQHARGRSHQEVLLSESGSEQQEEEDRRDEDKSECVVM